MGCAKIHARDDRYRNDAKRWPVQHIGQNADMGANRVGQMAAEIGRQTNAVDRVSKVAAGWRHTITGDRRHLMPGPLQIGAEIGVR